MKLPLLNWFSAAWTFKVQVGSPASGAGQGSAGKADVELGPSETKQVFLGDAPAQAQ
jgi:hypothetical protein